MSKTEIMTNLSRSFNRVGFKLKKHSPEILIVAGVVGTITSAVMACKATLKVNEIVDDAKENIDRIHEATEKGATAVGKDYTPEDGKKDLTAVYIQTGYKMAKLYAPAVALGVLSIGAIVTSNNILRKRYIATTAAYAALDKGFKEYRGRVIDRFGKELDYELRHGVKVKEVEQIVVEEDGSEHIVKDVVNAVDPTTISPYAIIYDDGCTGWTKDPEKNKFFLKSQETYLNERLKIRGHVFLNEVYDALGAPRTTAGQVVGWIYDEKYPNGDNFIDFGIFDIHDERKRDFVNGRERNILLDFNVDGVIYDKI